MKFIVILIISTLFASLVDDINNDPTSTWYVYLLILFFFICFLFRYAKEYPPEVITLEKMRGRLIHRPLKEKKPPRQIGHLIEADDSFDARDEWGDLILPVRDQGGCGSCWAFAVAETTGDRVGIEGLGSDVYSPQNLVSCDHIDDRCDGGEIDVSWNCVLIHGHALDSCIPYIFGGGDSGVCPFTYIIKSKIMKKKTTNVHDIDYDSLSYFLCSALNLV
jgi:hypothetical protein